MNPQFTYYGDDFTGSTDVLEVLGLHGISAVLFLGIPDQATLARFSGRQAIGIAGDSRSRPPDWMTAHLPTAFRWLEALGAPICQYKVCSTFDSSPEIGSIGRALEIGQDIFEAPMTPVVVGAPHLRRYVAFGHLFAGAGDGIHRVDRHPTMQRHPITPMNESDLRIHLSRQTSRAIGAMDLVALSKSDAETRLRHLPARAVIFDGVDRSGMLEVARLVWALRTPFVAGSSGFTQALVDYWQQTGLLNTAQATHTCSKVDRIVALSGSCSPVTEQQIRCVLRNGFTGIALQPGAWNARAVLDEALTHLSDGRSVVLYSALGANGIDDRVNREDLGVRMGVLLRDLLRQSGVKRAVVAGGDTASHAGKQLGIHALSFAAPMDPGSPLCAAHSDDRELQGLEVIFKGGQVGRENFFEWAMGGDS